MRRTPAAEPTEAGPLTQPFYTDHELAQRYRVNRATVWRWTRTGRFPQPVKVGPGSTRWRGADVLAFEAERAA